MKLNLDYRTAYVLSFVVTQLNRMGLDQAFTPVQIQQKSVRHYPVPGGPAGSLDGTGTAVSYRIWGGGVSVTAKVTSETPPPGPNSWTQHWVHELKVTTADKRRWLWREGWPRTVLLQSRPPRRPGHFLRLQAEKRAEQPGQPRRRSIRAMFRNEAEADNRPVVGVAPRPPYPAA